MIGTSDLSRCSVALDEDSTLIAVVEMGRPGWLVGALLPRVARRPLKKLPVDRDRLLHLLLDRWRDEAVRHPESLQNPPPRGVATFVTLGITIESSCSRSTSCGRTPGRRRGGARRRRIRASGLRAPGNPAPSGPAARPPGRRTGRAGKPPRPPPAPGPQSRQPARPSCPANDPVNHPVSDPAWGRWSSLRTAGRPAIRRGTACSPKAARWNRALRRSRRAAG